MVANPDRTNASIADASFVTSLLWLTIHALSIQMVFARAGTVRRGRKILMEKQSLGIVLGRDEQGGDIAFDLATLPHLLIGGSTGSGKSMCIKSILSQLMRTKTPDEVKFIIYDEKCIEFRRMGNCPYLFKPVITDPQVLLSVLEAVRDELEDRTQAIRNGDPVPRIVVVADEYAGLMVSHSERAEPLLAKMLVLGRAAGVHFVFATQRPDEVVMSPPLRCGFPGRIAFKVAFEEDSRMIIDETGADRLNGKGDFLFRDSTGLHRGQVPYISDEDFESLCAWTFPIFH